MFASRWRWDFALLHREELAVVFAAQNLHNFIASHKVTFNTDDQPVLGILGFTKPVPRVLSPCRARCAYDCPRSTTTSSNYQARLTKTQIP